MDRFYKTMKKAAERGWQAIIEEKNNGFRASIKSYRDFVTSCDIESERAIVNILAKAFPQSAFHCEEIEDIDGKGIFWVIDPLDGTHNFIFGIPFYAISIAAVLAGEITAGLIFLPEFKDFFYAYKGKGAYLNGERIKVSPRNTLGEAIIAYDNQFHKTPMMRKNLPRLIRECFTIRILGSAAVDLSKVSQGILDARIFHKTKSMDFAAGALIVEEAGGEVTDLKGKPYTLSSDNIVASNGKIHQQLLDVLEFKEIKS